MSGGASIFSEGTNIYTINLKFDFDAVLLGSQAYTSAHRSDLKQAVTTARAPQSSPSSNTQKLPISSLENPLGGFSRLLLPSVDDADNPNTHNKMGSAESDQITIQPIQTSTKAHHQMSHDHPNQRQDLSSTAQHDITTPT